MKAKDVHQGLPAQEMRDWLAQQYTQALDNGAHPSGDDERYVWEIARLERALAATHRMRAINTVLEMHGWQVHDVSDDVSDYPKGYMGFAGTDKERKERFK